MVVEDFGITPDWLESRTFMIAAGFTKSQTTKSSANFDKHGVSETGIRSFFRFSTGCFFGKGVTSTHFRVSGKRCYLNYALIIVFTGKASDSAYSFSSQLVIPSGPGAFAGSRLDNDLKVLSSDTSRNSG